MAPRVSCVPSAPSTCMHMHTHSHGRCNFSVRPGMHIPRSVDHKRSNFGQAVTITGSWGISLQKGEEEEEAEGEESGRHRLCVSPVDSSANSSRISWIPATRVVMRRFILIMCSSLAIVSTMVSGPPPNVYSNSRLKNLQLEISSLPEVKFRSGDFFFFF